MEQIFFAHFETETEKHHRMERVTDGDFMEWINKHTDEIKK